MSLHSEFRERLRAFLSREGGERELDEELRFHVEMQAEAYVREGLRPEAARRRAVLEFGGVERVKEQVRDARGLGLLEDTVRDVRHGARSLMRHRAFTATAVLTLALGIGATTAIFSVVSGLVLRPLPFADPGRLVQVYGTSRLYPERDAVTNLPGYRARSRSFEALVGYWVSARYLRGSGGAERVRVVVAERGFFPMLGVAPLVGRTFGPDDPPDVAVVSEAFWRRRLGGGPEAVGRRVTLDDRSFSVVGVMPEAFQFPYGAASLLPGVAAEARTDLWIPVDPPLGERSRICCVWDG
jgi:hypothetical protein